MTHIDQYRTTALLKKWAKILDWGRAGGVAFKEYEEFEGNLYDQYLGDILRYYVLGIERKDGSVVVYKDNIQLERPLRNEKIFKEKYFTEAL